MEPLGIAGIVVFVLVAAVVAVAYVGRVDFDKAERYRDLLTKSLRELEVTIGEFPEAFFDDIPESIQLLQAARNLAQSKLEELSRELADRDSSLAAARREFQNAVRSGDRIHAQLVETQTQLAAARKLLEVGEDAARNYLDRNAELEIAVDRLTSEIATNLAAKRPKPWKQFLSNLIGPSEVNQA